MAKAPPVKLLGKTLNEEDMTLPETSLLHQVALNQSKTKAYCIE